MGGTAAQFGFAVVGRLERNVGKVGSGENVENGGKLEGNVESVGKGVRTGALEEGSGAKVVVIEGIIVVVTGATVVVIGAKVIVVAGVAVVVAFVGKVIPG